MVKDNRKKGFVKTLEIFLVIVFTTIFLIVLMQRQFSSSTLEKDSYLIELERNQDFRDYISQNSGCLNSTSEPSSYIRQYLPTRFDYTLCINSVPEDLPGTDVYLDSIFFTGNLTSVQFKKIRLYYWVTS